MNLTELLKIELGKKIDEISNYFDNADVISYTGPFIDELTEEYFLSVIEDLVTESKESKESKIYIILTTTGGSASSVERCVSILRYHYTEVNFIVPNYAYSAGTIFCMSGDNILMDYYSVLGPIDPQVRNKEGKFVPALGYLDKINELLEKAKNGDLTQPEYLILKDFDLAELKSYEQARELSVTLLKKWLVKYKFKNWTITETNKKSVDQGCKEKRAEEIATALSDNNRWKSHGRPINLEALEDIKLKIENYSDNEELRNLIRSYSQLLQSFFKIAGDNIFIHTKKTF